MTSHHPARSKRRIAAAVCALGAVLALPAAPVHAQTTPSGGYRSSDGWSLLPGTRRGYAGINLGRPELDRGCGANANLGCDDADWRLHVYTGGLFNDWLGAEVGYLYEGEAQRAGGETRAEGINLSAVARAPLGQFNVFGKLGATYGRTRVSADPSSGIATGRDRGWGRSYGAGVGFDLTPTSGVVLEWSRNRFRFPGGVRDDIDAASLGYVHRF